MDLRILPTNTVHTYTCSGTHIKYGHTNHTFTYIRTPHVLVRTFTYVTSFLRSRTVYRGHGILGPSLRLRSVYLSLKECQYRDTDIYVFVPSLVQDPISWRTQVSTSIYVTRVFCYSKIIFLPDTTLTGSIVHNSRPNISFFQDFPLLWSILH